jgi:hypothetical protein
VSALHPTKTRLALLAAIKARKVTGYPTYDSDVDYFWEFTVTARVNEMIHAGWVPEYEPGPGGRTPDFKVGLTEKGWLVWAVGTLTTEEKAEFERMLAGLHAGGYQDVAEHKALKPGTRIRHSGHRWPEAIDKGTGVVIAITEKPDSSWSADWGRPDIELIALWDKPQPFARLSQLAQYHVAAVDGG